MKKEMLTIALFLGLSVKSFAAAGNTNDGPVFFLVIVGFLFILLALLGGVDYIQKNGKIMITNARSFFSTTITLLRNYLDKVKSDFFDLSYF